MNIYYKALICRQTIDMNWKRGGKFLPGLEDAEIQNNRNPNIIRIQTLDSELSPEKIEQLYRNEDKFMYSEGGARDCIKEIIKEGMFKKSWRDIAVCRNLRKQFTTKVNDIIDDYCMPRLKKRQREE